MMLKNLLVTLLILILFYLYSTEKLEANNTGRICTSPAPNHDGKIKILVYYDMEGISGQNDIKSLDLGNPEYEKIRHNLTADVNAVIKGLFAGGADEVDLVDAHGSGNQEPDVLLHRLDSRARHIVRDKWFDPYIDLTEADIYDAVVAVCMHSKTGGGGFAAHTYTIGMDWILNDHSITESDIIAFSWGKVDVPLIFVSGDNTLKNQLSWMYWLEYVTVKTAKEADDAILHPLAEVHEELCKAAKRALRKLSKSKAVKLVIPIKAQLRAVYPASLKDLEGVPGINYQNNTVSFIAMDFKEAYQGIEALIGVASRGYNRILMKVLRSQKLLDKVWPIFIDEWYKSWMDVESGRWKPSALKKKKTKNKKYYGF
jgi:D-amino peptidase